MGNGRPEETEEERADRNFGDLLQELRVAQTGVQILFAFLLTIPLQARFEKLDTWQRDVFIAALLFSALATACLIAPVAYHRVLFRQRLKDLIVRSASRFALAGLVFLGLAIVCSVHLVLDLVLNRPIAFAVAGALGVLLMTLWWALPLRHLQQRRNEQLEEDLTQ